jgi:aspartyl-tRNA(Asn)/glutamyl-tRNA(Gln) amidotransferase subunit C
MITKEELIEQSNVIQIALTEQESDTLLTQMNNIFDYVSIIKDYDCGDEAELQFMVDDNNRLREDISEESISLQDALKNAPKKNESFFKVPKVIE